jgi:EmrB/QacA subfamily drug resistance transporter
MTTSGQPAHPRRWAILGVLIFALFGITLDNTVLTVALPTLAHDLSASTSQLQWMVDAYILVFAGLLLVAGALSDRFGRRLVLVIGLGLFGLGSALAPFGSGAGQLIFLRGFMGLGAALAMPSTLSIVAGVFASDERPKAIAVWSGVSALGFVVGPIAGGILLERFAWPAVFIVNIPFALVGIAATLLVVPESRAPGRVPLDPIGALISVVGLTALVYGIIEGPSQGWASPRIAGSLVGAAVLAIVFVAWERRLEHPMLDVNLFRNRRFSAASISVTLSFFALTGVLFFITLYLQEVRGLSALDTGIRFIAIALGIVIASPVSVRLTTGYGARVVTALGLALVATAMGLVATIGVATGDLQIVAVIFVGSVGMGLSMTPATDAIMGALPVEKFGVGSAVNDTTRQVGSALGVAILGSVFSSAFAEHMTAMASLLPAEAAHVVRDSFAGAAAVAAQISGSQGGAILATARNAFVDSMAATSLIGVGFAVAGVIVALRFLPDRAGPQRAPDGIIGTAPGQLATPGGVAGKATPIINRTYPLSETHQAIDHVGAAHTRGKVATTV